MALDFPLPTIVGQTLIVGGVIWVWDGIAWHIKRTVSPPDGVLQGRFSLYAWRPGSLFTDFIDARTFATAVDSAAQRLALAPGVDIVGGRMLMQTDTGTLWLYDGAKWIVLRELQITNIVQPVIVGFARDGETLHVTLGAWRGEPETLSIQWMRDGIDIRDAIGQVYTIQTADVAARLSVRVTASKAGVASVSATSPLTQVVLSVASVAPLANIAIPAISGTPQEGQALSVTSGSWTGAPSVFLYQWLRNGAPILGATASTLLLAVADVGAVISASVTAAKDGTPSVTVSSSLTAIVVSAATVAPISSVTLPTISGLAQEGSVLTASLGTWNGAPTSYNFQWLRAGVVISGATSSVYTPVSADVGSTISVRVTANKGGTPSIAAVSASTGGILAVSIINTSLPSITGINQEGQVLTASAGTWSGSPTGYTYQWRRGSVNISGATASSYVITETDVGSTISVQVTASKPGVASISAISPNTLTVFAIPLANTALPSLSGTAQAGETLTASVGTWTGSPTTFTYRWLRSGTPIPGATSTTYAVTLLDVGTTLAVEVTASKNGTANVIALSAYTGSVLSDALRNQTLPAITGSLVQGQVLSVSSGTWSGNPTLFTYQWRRGGVPLAGQTATTYTVTPADVGSRLSVLVTASKAGVVDAAAATLDTAPIASTPLVNAALPVIFGIAADGQALTVSSGTWTGTPTSYFYQWQANGANIPGETDATYGLVTGDVGKVITVRVTASKLGTADVTVTTLPTAAVVAALPVNVGVPVITGTFTEGQTLSVTNGTWTSAPTSFTYQWQRGFTAIPGATSSTYTLVPADAGARMTVKVTAFLGLIASQQVETDPDSHPIIAFTPIANTALPVITGTLTEGQVLTVSNGSWTGGPTSYRYQWFRNGVAISNTLLVPSREASYTLQAADAGAGISCAVTALKRPTPGSSNALENSAQISTATTGAITILPLVNITPPAITGTGYQNDTLVVSDGTWTGGPTSFSYRWRRNGVVISGATQPQYVPVLADVGAAISVEVTARKTGVSSVIAFSAATASILAATPALSNASLPSISGTLRDGSVLTCDPGTWSGSPTAFSYQWLYNGISINNATSSTYMLTNVEIGYQMSCRVTADKTGALAVVATSPLTAVVVEDPIVNLIAPVASGTFSEGNTINVSPGSWAGAGDLPNLSARWFRNGVLIPGVTSRSYTLTLGDVGAVITIEIRCQATNKTPVTIVLPPSPIISTTPIQFSTTTQIDAVNKDISGIARQGEILTAETIRFSKNPTSFTFQWLRGAASIPGAVGQTYQLTAADVGAMISVTVTASKANVPDVSGTLKPIGPIVATGQNLPPLVPVGIPFLSGTSRIGSILAINNRVIGQEDIVFPDVSPQYYLYEYRADGVVVRPPAASITYGSPSNPSDLGRTITGHLYAFKAGAPVNPVEVRTVATPPLVAATDPVPVPVEQAPLTISGTPQVGSVLRAYLVPYVNATSYVYQWLKDGVVIPGAMSNSYTAGSGDVGSFISVRVTASNSSGSSIPATSPSLQITT